MSAQRKPKSDLSATARIEVVERRARTRAGVIPCVINHHLAIDPASLSEFCFRELTPRIDDLVLIAASVAFADRSVSRHTSEGWARHLSMLIPVLEPDFWTQSAVSQALSDLLEFLTGDLWTFEFRHRRAMTSVNAQPSLKLTHLAPPIVMPFSDGLDSLAGARLTSANEPDATLILVTAGRRHDVDKPWREQHLNAHRYRLVLPFRFMNSESGHKFREDSFRSRGFMYGVMSGIAAHLSGGERVIFAESGQGSLGPWLVPVGNEALDVRMHPVYTHRLAQMLKLVLGTPLKYEHPRLWKSKGETLKELSVRGLADDWFETRSCPRDARHMSRDRTLVQCGVCAGCLLRRQSLFAAELDEQHERYPYFWQKLTATSLASASTFRTRPTRHNDERQAICGFLSLAQLADLAQLPKTSARIATLTRELADALGEDVTVVQRKLDGLLAAHHNEWTRFLDRQGKDSFLQRWQTDRGL
jgi:hypothetical protein